MLGSEKTSHVEEDPREVAYEGSRMSVFLKKQKEQTRVFDETRNSGYEEGCVGREGITE